MHVFTYMCMHMYVYYQRQHGGILKGSMEEDAPPCCLWSKTRYEAVPKGSTSHEKTERVALKPSNENTQAVANGSTHQKVDTRQELKAPLIKRRHRQFLRALLIQIKQGGSRHDQPGHAFSSSIFLPYAIDLKLPYVY